MIDKDASFLVVDDDDVFRRRMELALRDRGFEVFSAANIQEAKALAQSESIEYAIVDLKIKQESGLLVIKELLAIEPAMQIVMLTGYGSVNTALESIKLGAVWYLQKPCDLNVVLQGFEKKDQKGNEKTPISTPSLARLEWDHIDRVLQDVDGNISEAARRLGLHRRSLARKLQKRPPKL